MSKISLADISDTALHQLLISVLSLDQLRVQPLLNKIAERRADRLFPFEDEASFRRAMIETGLSAQEADQINNLISFGPVDLEPDPALSNIEDPDPNEYVEIGKDPTLPDTIKEDVPETPSAPASWSSDQPFPIRNRPIVVVPGIMGSALNDTSGPTEEQIWPPITTKGVLLLERLVRAFSNKTLKASGKGAFGAYSGLLAWLESIGYSEKNGNLLFFGYNWSQSNKTSGVELKAAVDSFLKRFNSLFEPQHTEVDIIAHSMGGLVTRSAIKDGMKVRRTAYIATPHYGAPNAYFTAHPNIELFGFWTEFGFDVANYALDRDEVDDLGPTLKKIARSCKSVWELLPNKYYLTRGNYMIRVEMKSGKWHKKMQGTWQHYFYDEWQFPTGWRKNVKEGLAFSEGLGPTPSEPYIVIINDENKTPDRIEYDLEWVGGGSFDDIEASIHFGDGTVPKHSATLGGTNASIRRVAGEKYDHLALPNAPQTHSILTQYFNL